MLLHVTRGFRGVIARKFTSKLLNNYNLKRSIRCKSTIDDSLKNEISDTDLFSIELPSNENNENLLRIRHSSAHVMAMAVQRLFPDTKVTIGPWIDNGFVQY